MKIYHYRYRNILGEIQNKGGVTLIIEQPAYNVVTIGYSICSMKDLFDKKTGVAIAKQRLEKDPIYVDPFYAIPTKSTMLDLLLDGVIRQTNGVPFFDDMTINWWSCIDQRKM
jgi:hypothetical protein